MNRNVIPKPLAIPSSFFSPHIIAANAATPKTEDQKNLSVMVASALCQQSCRFFKPLSFDLISL